MTAYAYYPGCSLSGLGKPYDESLRAVFRYLGLGLASVVNAVDPARIFISGEIIAAWDLTEVTLRQAVGTRVLAPAATGIEITTLPLPDHPRLRGAAALAKFK